MVDAAIQFNFKRFHLMAGLPSEIQYELTNATSEQINVYMRTECRTAKYSYIHTNYKTI